MNRTNNVVHVSTRSWSSSLVLVGVLLALLGIWAALVALVGPYFSFGFDTPGTWPFRASLDAQHRPWNRPPRGRRRDRARWNRRARLGALLALVAGIWLVAGPFLHGIWSSESRSIGERGLEARLLWIGWYVGVGAAALGLASYALGLLARQRFAGSVLVEEPTSWHSPSRS